MGPLTLSAIGFGAVLAMIALRAPIALAMGTVGVLGTGFVRGSDVMLYTLGNTPFEVLNNYNLSILPMFILMGALAVKTGLARDLVAAANALIGHYRGGLAMGAVVACAGFGAVSGSNLATLSTMSKITIPEMLRRGYSPRLAAGSLASASTLDILIPPSIPMVIYAAMTESSVGRILAAGIVPGVVLTILFILAIRIWVARSPQIAPPAGVRLTWSERWPQLKSVFNVLFVFAVMMLGMSLGWFSPTEAAAVGAAGVLSVGIAKGQMTLRGFAESVREAVHLSAIIYLILIGIVLFHFFMDSIGLQREINRLLGEIRLPAGALMGLILVALILLGCVMDAMSILFITTPFLYPVVQGLGYDVTWFGVVMVMTIQLGLIHPPFGLNVFILSGLIKECSVTETFWGCVPFVLAVMLVIAMVLAFPQVILWLPNQMFN